MSREIQERFDLAKKTIEQIGGVRIEYTEIIPEDIEADEAEPGATLTLKSLERLAALLVMLRDQRFGEPAVNDLSFLDRQAPRPFVGDSILPPDVQTSAPTTKESP